MPTYCFQCGCGEHKEVVAPIDGRPARIRCERCDAWMRRDFRMECGRHGPADPWPLASEAMAVHPDQIPEAREVLDRHGVHADFDRYGRPILMSNAHRNRVMAAFGFGDKDAGYLQRPPGG